MYRIKWLVLNYNLPSEPSRHRVAVWRALKKLGAANIQQSMWIMPDSEENLNALKKISRDIEGSGGEALMMESAFLEEEHEKRIQAVFNRLRDEEYCELVSECRKYLAEIEKEIANEKFTFAEMEEEESELEKLTSWHGRIEKRDIFLAEAGKEAREMLSRINGAFQVFSSKVYESETGGSEE
jgi:DNA-binding transcriptional regulator PaaX